MTTKKNKATTVFTTNYVYCVYGDGLKVQYSYIESSATHPETKLDELKKYYGNGIKGFYCKTTESFESITEKLQKELEDKTSHSDYLYELKVTDAKKIIRSVTGAKTGSTMGPPKVKSSDKKEDEEDEDDDDDEDDEDDDEKEEPEVKKKAVKESKTKDVKEAKKETESKKKETESKKKETESKKKETESKKKETESKKKEAKIVKEEKIVKSNKTVIEISDDSDEDEEN